MVLSGTYHLFACHSDLGMVLVPQRTRRKAKMEQGVHRLTR